jgi:double-stranded uracil-DNA glycosylase
VAEPGLAPVRGFAPIAAPQAGVLVLGSMPGVASLRAGQYYGHPRNAFWPIMAAVFGFDATAPYLQRVAALQHNGVAVWDVLAACVRPGSLDADIHADSIRVNDFDRFLRAHPGLRCVCFNGAKAQTVFRRQVLPMLAVAPTFNMVHLPSTSPAHAGMPFDEKCRLWRQHLLQA